MNRFSHFTAILCVAAMAVHAETQYLVGEQIDVAYVDSERLFFAWMPENVNHAIPLTVLHLDETEQLNRYFLMGAISPCQFENQDLPPLPLNWFVEDKIPYSIMGDAIISSIGHFFIYLCPGCVEPYRPGPIDKTNPEMVKQEQDRAKTALKWEKERSSFSIGANFKRLDPLTLNPGFVWRVPQRQTTPDEGRESREKQKVKVEVPWFGFSRTNMAVRLTYPDSEPILKALVKHPDDVIKRPLPPGVVKPLWCFAENPGGVIWVEFQIDLEGSFRSELDMTGLHSEKYPWEGFSPIAITRVAGQKIKRDDLSIAIPQDADWLIWEKNTNGVVRLCQMKGGHWSPVREVPRAPQTIVVDNDTEMVHLLYDFAIDRADIDDSLRRLASLLKAPQPAP